MFFLRALFSAIIVCLCTSNNQLTSAYRNFYWREWNGTVHDDAVTGGIIDGVVTYIGSSYFPEERAILVSNVTKSSKVANTHLSNMFLTTSNLTNVLCAAKDSQPIWKKVHIDSMFTPECKFIKGGYFAGSDLYIGRKKEGNNIFVGFAFPAGHKYAGFEYWNKTTFLQIKEFEALAYCDCICPCKEL